MSLVHLIHRNLSNLSNLEQMPLFYSFKFVIFHPLWPKASFEDDLIKRIPIFIINFNIEERVVDYYEQDYHLKILP